MVNGALALVERATAVLLDFDGPVCSVFARFPAADVTQRLRNHLRQLAPQVQMPDTGDDPLEVLRWIAGEAPALADSAENFLSARELEAAALATPTDGCAQFLGVMAEARRPVAVVSNNSEPAIRRYLVLQGLAPLVGAVVGRDPSDAHTMKPHPKSLLSAVHQLRVPSDECVMIGDSLSDIEAAQRIGAQAIGLANKPGKATRFRALGASAVVHSMRQLLVE